MNAIPPRVGSPQSPSGCAGIVSDLLVRCGRGEVPALGSLFDVMYGVVVATLRRRLPAAAETDDLVVEVFHDIWLAAPSFRAGRQNPVVWVLEVTEAAVRPTRPTLVAS